MALLCLLAFVMCELLLLLQSTRLNRRIAHEVQSSVHPEDADMTDVAYDETLLACEAVEKNIRCIIHSKDQPFAAYLGKVSSGQFQKPSTIKCKTFTPPPKPSTILRNLATHTIPQDVIGVIGSFNHDVHCKVCKLFSFNMTHFERCRTALTLKQWARVHREVKEEGGSCLPSFPSIIEKQTLQTCMTSAKANQVAVCGMESVSVDNIKVNESRIKENEDAIQARQELIKKKSQEHEEFIEESQQFIKKKQENIVDLLNDLDMHKQNNVYVKQIFEGP